MVKSPEDLPCPWEQSEYLLLHGLWLPTSHCSSLNLPFAHRVPNTLALVYWASRPSVITTQELVLSLPTAKSASLWLFHSLSFLILQSSEYT